jgi:hypothetical protein
LVPTYYNRLGLGDLLKRREFGGGQEEEPPQLPQSPQKARPCGSALSADPQDVCPPDNRAPNAEGSRLVEPDKINPDMIVSLVADDPEVKEAVARLDRATPSTHYDLVRARDEAQARMGIPVANRAFLYSAEVDDYLLPIVNCMWPGDEAATAQAIRRDFDERDGDLSSRAPSVMRSWRGPAGVRHALEDSGRPLNNGVRVTHCHQPRSPQSWRPHLYLVKVDTNEDSSASVSSGAKSSPTGKMVSRPSRSTMHICRR